MMHGNERRLLAWFAALAILFSTIAYVPILRTGNLVPGGSKSFVLLLMWGPGFAALLARLIVQRNFRGMGWAPAPRMLLLALLLPVAAAGVVYGLCWQFGWAGFDVAPLQAMGSGWGLAGAIVLGLTMALLFATGEELGWRGLLLPELAKRMTPARAAIASGIAWALYHYPAMLFTDYHSAAPRAYAMGVFTITVFALSFVLGWLRLRSGSFWPAAMLHASHNFFVQSIFDRITVNRGITPYLTTEFGAGLCLAYVAIAIFVWRRWPPAALRA